MLCIISREQKNKIKETKDLEKMLNRFVNYYKKFERQEKLTNMLTFKKLEF